MDKALEAALRPAAFEVALELKGVWKIFGDAEQQAYQHVLQHQSSKQELLKQFNCVIGVADVNLQIRRGEIFCIMGLSGSGKSTLVRHINRLLDPTAGEVHVDGKDIMLMDDGELRTFRNQHISMVFQNFALMPHMSIGLPSASSIAMAGGELFHTTL